MTSAWPYPKAESSAAPSAAAAPAAAAPAATAEPSRAILERPDYRSVVEQGAAGIPLRGSRAAGRNVDDAGAADVAPTFDADSPMMTVRDALNSAMVGLNCAHHNSCTTYCNCARNIIIHVSYLFSARFLPQFVPVLAASSWNAL